MDVQAWMSGNRLRFGEDAELAGANDCFSAVVGLQFAIDVCRMRFDRAGSNDQLCSDVLVGIVLGQQTEHGQLALAQWHDVCLNAAIVHPGRGLGPGYRFGCRLDIDTWLGPGLIGSQQPAGISGQRPRPDWFRSD